MAPIRQGVVRPSPARFERHELDLFGVELEVGFELRAPLPSFEAPDFAARARGCVAAAAMIEVVDTRLADPLLVLADDQINAGLVVGALHGGFGDLARAEVELWIGDARVQGGSAEVPGGDAFETFLAFARMVGDHCGGLRVGQVVTTGSLAGLRFVERGCDVRGQIEGLGEVAITFAA